MATSNGLVVGVVTDLNDPESLGRVRVRLPNFDNQNTFWARLVTLMAGKERGAFFCPEVDDEVLVGFEHNDKRRPYVLGAVWSSEDPPPENDGNKTDNNWRFIKSRSGHLIILNDEQGSETIEVIDKSGSNSIVIDTASNQITVKSAQTVKVESSSVEVKGQTSIKLEAPTIDVKATGSLNLEAGGTLKVQGSLVTIN